MDATTPSGDPSGPNAKARLGDKPWLFLARHGAGHKLLPHEVTNAPPSTRCQTSARRSAGRAA